MSRVYAKIEFDGEVFEVKCNYKDDNGSSNINDFLIVRGDYIDLSKDSLDEDDINDRNLDDFINKVNNNCNVNPNKILEEIYNGMKKLSKLFKENRFSTMNCVIDLSTVETVVSDLYFVADFIVNDIVDGRMELEKILVKYKDTTITGIDMDEMKELEYNADAIRDKLIKYIEHTLDTKLSEETTKRLDELIDLDGDYIDLPNDMYRQDDVSITVKRRVKLLNI